MQGDRAQTENNDFAKKEAKMSVQDTEASKTLRTGSRNEGSEESRDPKKLHVFLVNPWQRARLWIQRGKFCENCKRMIVSGLKTK